MPKRLPTHQIDTDGATDGDNLTYEAATDKWVPGASPGAGPFILENGAATISSRNDEPTDPQVGDLWFDADATLPPIDAADVVVDDSAFDNITGTDVQVALDSIDDALGSIPASLAVEEENVAVASGVSTLNFVGATVTDDGGGQVTVTIDAASGTTAWMPLTTVVGGVPELVWDDDDSLIPTEVPL